MKIDLTCDDCGERVHRARVLTSGKTVGHDCRCARSVGVMVDADNPFRTSGELTLQHVHGEDGNPLRVTSMRELQAAENKYHFNHIPTNMDRSNWDTPKQQQVYQVGDRYRRKFAAGR
jgi:hypothetical protein